MAGRPKGSAHSRQCTFRLSPEADSALTDLANLFHGGNRTAALEALIFGHEKVPTLVSANDLATILSIHKTTVWRHAKALGVKPIVGMGYARYPLAPFLSYHPPRGRPRKNVPPPPQKRNLQVAEH